MYQVGIIHTNYCYYASTARVNYALPGSLRRSWVWALNKLMARAYCDKIIKLSSTLQSFASEKETVCNVHGVSQFQSQLRGGRGGENDDE